MYRRLAGDLAKKYNIHNMFDAFYDQRLTAGERWAVILRTTRYIYECETGETYKDLAELLEGTFEDMLHNRPMQDKSKEANAFLDRYHSKRLVILELGIGSRNRLIKLPLMQLTANERQSVYVTLNLAQELYVPVEIADRSVPVAGDIAVTLHKLKEALTNRI